MTDQLSAELSLNHRRERANPLANQRKFIKVSHHVLPSSDELTGGHYIKTSTHQWYYPRTRIPRVYNEFTFHSEAPSLSFVCLGFPHRQERCTPLWNAPLGPVTARYESEATSKPNIFRDERGPVSLAGENKPLALWEMDQKPPFRNAILALSRGGLTTRCDLSRHVEYHKYNNWTKATVQLHWCHSNKMPRKDRRHMHSRIHSPSLLASGDGGWSVFDDTLAESLCSLDWWCLYSVKGRCYETTASLLNCSSSTTDGGKWRNRVSLPRLSITTSSVFAVYFKSVSQLLDSQMSPEYWMSSV